MTSTLIRHRVTDYEMKYELKNASEKDVSIKIYQSLSGYRNDYKFSNESHSGKYKHDSSRVWEVTIPAQGSSELSYTVRETGI